MYEVRVQHMISVGTFTLYIRVNYVDTPHSFFIITPSFTTIFLVGVHDVISFKQLREIVEK